MRAQSQLDTPGIPQHKGKSFVVSCCVVSRNIFLLGQDPLPSLKSTVVGSDRAKFPQLTQFSPMEVCFLVLEPHFCCHFVPCKLHLILDFRPFGVAQDRFWILDSAESALKSRNQFGMRRAPFFGLHLLNKIQIAN